MLLHSILWYDSWFHQPLFINYTIIFSLTNGNLGKSTSDLLNDLDRVDRMVNNEQTAMCRMLGCGRFSRTP